MTTFQVAPANVDTSS